MAFTRESFGESLFDSVGQSHRDLPATLEALACALVSHGRLRTLVMELPDIGSLTIERRGHGPVAYWQARPLSTAKQSRDGRLAKTQAAALAGELTHEIAFAGRGLGRMRTRALGSAPGADPLRALLDQFARQCGRLVARDGLEKWSLARLGRPLRLIGLSAAMRDLDGSVEAAATSPLPVLLQGEFGTQKLAIAAAIHCCGPQAEKPFVAVDCSDPDGSPGEWLERARGGTLYLSGIDCLPPPLQQALPRHLPSRLALWPQTGVQPAARIVTSTTASLPQLVAEQRFSRALATELAVLEIEVPALRERIGDIPALIRDAIARLGYDANRKVSEALTDACLAYDWPDNDAQLEQVIGRLATMTGGDPILTSDIRRHAPALLGPAVVSPATIAEMASRGPGALVEWPPPAATPLDSWALRALDPEERFAELDPALAKTLRHLGTCFEDMIGLADLAAIGGTTSLRLSALFRATIGVSFKKLLRRIRILVACERLANEPAMAITQLAFEVGFGDLSYFERSFRSAVGVNARQFRQQRRLGDHAASVSVLSDPAQFHPGLCGGNPKRSNLPE